MVIFQCNVFDARYKLRTFGHLDAAVIVFPNSAEKPRLLLTQTLREEILELRHKV